MASAGSGSFAPVLAALSVMQSNVAQAQKSQAHDYLEKFQKSVRRLRSHLFLQRRHTDDCATQPDAWITTHSLLSSSDTVAEVKLFAATTLKGKVGSLALSIMACSRIPRSPMI